MTQRQIALVAFGANLPSGETPPEISVGQAMARLSHSVVGPVFHSALYHTPAFPPGAGPEFVNAAMAFDWVGSADDLLAALHGIEDAFGRRRAHRWEARVMDLDLIALGDSVLPDPQTQAAWRNLAPEMAACDVPDVLILPHPRLAERPFVLVPLADVAPNWVHPVTGLSVLQMRDAFGADDLAAIRLLAEGT